MAPPKRRGSYITTQLDSINLHLQNLFDDIGLSPQDREDRERQLYSVISDALESYVVQVKAERDAVKQQCERVQTDIHAMLNSLHDVDINRLLNTTGSANATKINELLYSDSAVQPPYKDILTLLSQVRSKIEEVYEERSGIATGMFTELEELVEKLGIDDEDDSTNTNSRDKQDPRKSSSNDLSDLRIKRTHMRIAPELTRPTSTDEVDLSTEYLTKFEAEIIRWRTELQSRVASVSIAASKIVALWADLGTPQMEIDRDIMANYKSSPELIGSTIPDLDRIETLLISLATEKQRREERSAFLAKEINKLWEKLEEDPAYTSAFERQNRGLGQQVLDACEQEYERLLEKKRQHVGIFIQDARNQLEQLWDRLYFSEQETYEFSPAWADIFTDASLEAHETEIERLQKLLVEREPVIRLIDQYKELQKEERDLAASSQDASRLLQRGGGTVKRDPTRLLREEQMRKRIAKRKPKVMQDLKAGLDEWKAKTGKPFSINGEDFSSVLEEELSKIAPGSRIGLTRGRPPTNSNNNLASSSTTSASRMGSRGEMGPPSTAGGRMSPVKPTANRALSRAAGAVSPTRSLNSRQTSHSSISSSRTASPTRAPSARPKSVLGREINSTATKQTSSSFGVSIPNLAPRAQSSLGSYRTGSPPSPIRPNARPVSVIGNPVKSSTNMRSTTNQQQGLQQGPLNTSSPGHFRSRSELTMFSGSNSSSSNNMNGLPTRPIVQLQHPQTTGARLSELSLGSPAHHSTMLMSADRFGSTGSNKENRDNEEKVAKDKLFSQEPAPQADDEVFADQESVSTINTNHSVVFNANHRYPEQQMGVNQLQQLQQQQQELQVLQHLQQQQKALLKAYDLNNAGSEDVIMASPSPVNNRYHNNNNNQGAEMYNSPLGHKSRTFNQFSSESGGNMLPGGSDFDDPLYQQWRENALKKLMNPQAELAHGTKEQHYQNELLHHQQQVNLAPVTPPVHLHKHRSERMSEFSWEKDTF